MAKQEPARKQEQPSGGGHPGASATAPPRDARTTAAGEGGSGPGLTPRGHGAHRPAGGTDAPTAPHDTRSPRSRRGGLADRLGPHGAGPEGRGPGTRDEPVEIWDREFAWARDVVAAQEAASGGATDGEEPAPKGGEQHPAHGAEPAGDDAASGDRAGSDQSFFWKSVAADGPDEPWKSLFR